MRRFIYLLCLIIILLINSCGKDGAEGKAYIKFDWSWTLTSYYDNNPSIPYTIYRNQDYETDAGNYDFQYEVDNGTEYRLWVGNYSISKNPGEKGSLLVDGKDGAPKHFKLYLGWSGATITVSKSFDFSEDSVFDKIQSPVNKTNKIIEDVKINYDKIKEQNIIDGNISINLKYWRVK